MTIATSETAKARAKLDREIELALAQAEWELAAMVAQVPTWLPIDLLAAEGDSSEAAARYALGRQIVYQAVRRAHDAMHDHRVLKRLAADEG